MALDIEKNIANLVQSQFPEFYNTDGPEFIAFVKAYYAFLDNGGSESRKVLSYRDIDTTLDQFVSKFQAEYLTGIPAKTAASKATLIKHIQDLYKSKGSTDSFKLLFSLVFGDDIDVYNPFTDVIKPSDGIWRIRQYLECTVSSRTANFIGTQVTGATSGATAFVENITRKNINGRFIDVVYLSNIVGNFQTGEYITNTNSLIDAPQVAGSLNNIIITEGGANNKIGDLFNISGPGGLGGQAIVRSTISSTGAVQFNLVDGGYGYETNSTILVSDAVIGYANNTGTILPLMSVTQPLQSINYQNLNVGSFTRTLPVTGYNSNNVLLPVATGYIVGVFPASNTTGNLVISTTSGIWNNATGTIVVTSNNAVNATIHTYSNVSAHATIIGSNTTFMGLSSLSGTLYPDAALLFYIGQPVGLVTTNTNTNVVTGNNANFNFPQVNAGDHLYFRANNGFIGVVNSVTNSSYLTLLSNSNYNVANNTVWRTFVTGAANAGEVYNTGSGATFSIGTLINQETIAAQPDVLVGNNSAGVAILDLLISGSNSGQPTRRFSTASGTITCNTANVIVTGSGTQFTNTQQGFGIGSTLNAPNGSSVGIINTIVSNTVLYLSSNASITLTSNQCTCNTTEYGFSGDGTIGYLNGLISNSLTNNTTIIGTIQSLSAVNPGSNYNAAPFTYIYDKNTAAYNYRDVFLNLSSTNFNFSPGQSIFGQTTLSSTLLVLNTNSGGSFNVGEGILQATTGAMGVVTAKTTNTLSINVLSGTFLTTYSITGQSTYTTDVVDTVTTTSSPVLAKGLIKGVSSNTISVRRQSFNYAFSNNLQVYSQDSLGTRFGNGFINTVSSDYSSNTWMGFNAAITDNVVTANAITKTLQVLSSGYGYSNGASLILTGVTNTNAQDIFGTASVQYQGIANGYWENTNGQLNSNKYIHDNQYYQEYSYEIQTKLSLNKYSDMVKKLVHVAGTELFGKAIVKSEINAPLNTPGVNITIS